MNMELGGGGEGRGTHIQNRLHERLATKHKQVSGQAGQETNTGFTRGWLRSTNTGSIRKQTVDRYLLGNEQRSGWGMGGGVEGGGHTTFGTGFMKGWLTNSNRLHKNLAKKHKQAL